MRPTLSQHIVITIGIKNREFNMDIKSEILHYIAVYDGSSKRIKERIEQDIICAFPNKERQKYINAIDIAISQLIKENVIRFVPYSEMSDRQKRYYESDGMVIYEILK